MSDATVDAFVKDGAEKAAELMGATEALNVGHAVEEVVGIFEKAQALLLRGVRGAVRVFTGGGGEEGSRKGAGRAGR